jgi:hypothetical protein
MSTADESIPSDIQLFNGVIDIMSKTNIFSSRSATLIMISWDVSAYTSQ